MNKDSTRDSSSSEDAPLTDFSNCHIGIIRNFESLKTLASEEIVINDETRAVAKELLVFFKNVVLEHHSEEEEELFDAVKHSALPGDELEEAKRLIDQLVKEHRALEAQWKALAPQLKKLSKGKSSEVNREAAIRLATEYLAHAKFEEDVFLPFSEKVLKKTGMSALGLSLHMRHTNTGLSHI